MKTINSLNKQGIHSLWHFTDLSNIVSIKKYGILSLKRITKLGVNAKYGADTLSHSLDCNKGFDRYVHISFLDDHPMYYVAKNRGSIISGVWIELDISLLNQKNIIASDAVANSNYANIFDIRFATKYINFDAMFSKDFLVRKDARKAEIMIPKYIDPSYIKGVYYGK